MTNPELNKAETKTAQERALLAHLRAIEQPTPSADLDAAILREIETALLKEAKEAEAKLKTGAQTQEPTESAAVEGNARSSAKPTFTPAWLEHLRRWWYLPVTAVAGLLVTIQLMNTESRPSANLILPPNLPSIADAKNAAQTSTKVQTADAAPHAESHVAEKAVADAGVATDTKTQPSALTKQEANPKNNSNLDARSKAGTQIAKADAKPGMSSSGAISDAEKSTTAPPAPVMAALKTVPSEIVVASKESAQSETLTQLEKASTVAAEAPKPSEIRRVQVSGSRIRLESSESSAAVLTGDAFKEEAAKKVAPEPKMTVAALPAPNETAKAPEAPRLVVNIVEPVLSKPTAPVAPVAPVAPIAPIVPAMAAAPVENDLSRARNGSEQRQSISQEIERLLAQQRTFEALKMWHEFKKQFPQQSLPASLEDRLKKLEQSQNKK